MINNIKLYLIIKSDKLLLINYYLFIMIENILCLIIYYLMNFLINIDIYY